MSKPLILNYYEFDPSKHSKFFNDKKTTFKLKCKYCPKEISAAIDITSNWLIHIKVKHTEQYAEYELNKEKKKQPVIYILFIE